MAGKGAVKVLIVGGGKGGDALINVFCKSKGIDIIGVIDKDSAALGIKKAKALNIPVADDYEKFIKGGKVDEIFNVTGSEKVQDDLDSKAPHGVDVISGHSAKLIWELIREHIEAEKALEESKKFAETTMDSVKDAICVIDTSDYKILGVNKAFLDSVEMDEKDVIGKPCYEITHNISSPCTPPHDTCPLKETLKTGTYALEEHIHFTETGKKRYVEVATSPIKDKNGKVSSVVHVMRDITERKLAEEAVRDAKEYAEHIFKVIPSAIFSIDLDRRITSWNKKAEEITGYSAKEIIGKKCDVFAGEPCDKKCGLYSDDVQKPMENRECTINKKDGTRIFVSKNVDILRDKQGNVIGGVESFIDITSQKRSQEMMRSAYTELDQIFQSSGDGMLVFDKELRIVRANKTLLDLVGKTRRELVA
ncbi:MAG: PAS domain S-box protein, partial [Candidatus Omnitrophota bacterium]